MTKTLKEIQAENRKLILEAIHGCSYEEIVQKEEIMKMDSSSWNYAYQLKNDVNFDDDDDDDDDDTIIDKPITLNKVLLAIIKSSKCMDSKENLQKIRNFVLENWDLELENLEQQIEEKQIEINKILNA